MYDDRHTTYMDGYTAVALVVFEGQVMCQVLMVQAE